MSQYWSTEYTRNSHTQVLLTTFVARDTAEYYPFTLIIDIAKSWNLGQELQNRVLSLLNPES